MAETSLRAPAKINFGLRIVGRRADGYHLLESVFAPIDLHDDVQLVIEPSDRTRVDIEVALTASLPQGGGHAIPTGPGNLAYRAAETFLRAAGLTCRVRLGLVKRIPAGGGLGGGSSDAGAVLRGLSHLFPGALPPQALADLALSLGADVPFFLDPGPALVQGVGEQIEALAEFPPLSLLLAHPGEALPTPEVFRAWDALAPALTPSPAGSTLRALSALLAGDLADARVLAGALGELLENDLERAAVRLCPPVGRLQERLSKAGALATGMSGSGATVFGVFPDAAAAARGLEQFAPGAQEWCQLAQTVARAGVAG